MSDAELILVAGALLAAGIGASLLAGRLRLPGLVLFLALGMAIGSDGIGWIDFDDYELARTIGVIALALILFEGGLDLRLPRDPAGAAARDLAGGARDDRDRGGHRAGRRVAARLLDRWRGCCWARSWPRPTAPRSSPCCAARRCGAGSRERSRPSPGSTTRSRSCSCSGSSTGSRQPGYGVADMAWLFARELGIGLVVGLAVGRLPPCGRSGGSTSTTRGPLPGGLGRHRGRSRTAARRSSTARASSSVYLAGLALGGAHIPPSARSPPSTRASPGWRRSPSSSRSACSSSRVSSATCCRREPSSPWWSRSWRGPLATCAGHRASIASALASGWSSGWAGLRGAVPGRAGDLPGDQRRSPQPRVLQHRLLRGRHLDHRPGDDLRAAGPGLGTTTASRRCRGRCRDGDDPRLGAEVVEYVVGDDAIAGRGSASWGSPRGAGQRDRAGRGDPARGSPGRGATGCTSWSGRRWREFAG